MRTLLLLLFYYYVTLIVLLFYYLLWLLIFCYYLTLILLLFYLPLSVFNQFFFLNLNFYFLVGDVILFLLRITLIILICSLVFLICDISIYLDILFKLPVCDIYSSSFDEYCWILSSLNRSDVIFSFYETYYLSFIFNYSFSLLFLFPLFESSWGFFILEVFICSIDACQFKKLNSRKNSSFTQFYLKNNSSNL